MIMCSQAFEKTSKAYKQSIKMHHIFASTRRKWSSKKRHDVICIKLLLVYDMYKLIASLLIGIDIGTGHRLVGVYG